jgi:trehalose synthase
MDRQQRLTTIDDYEPFIGAAAVDRIYQKAERLRGLHVANVNSTFYGGGVAELLSSLTLLMNSVGIKTGWRAIQGSPDYFSITKKMHNALQGGSINLTDRKKQIYEDVIYENAVRNHLTHDLVVIHDPQPLPMIAHYKRKGPWIWRCHLDLSVRDASMWRYLTPFIEQYDAVIVSMDSYRQELKTPQLSFLPAINPFSIKNKEMSCREVDERLAHYDIPTDLPLIVQISRFDKFKDPEGVIKAFKRARKQVDATLVLLGNVATDDPEGPRVYESLLEERDDRILILSQEDTALVNALQRKACVVLQKSIREGFGLTVTEAMWKGTPVIGGRVGGICCQIDDGVNGFLVSGVEEAADRMVRLIRDEPLRQRMAAAARESVQQRFLLTRLLEQYLDLFASFETRFILKQPPRPAE